MALFTTNEKAQRIIRRQKYFSPITSIIYFIDLLYLLFDLRNRHFDNDPLQLFMFLSLLLGLIVFTWYVWFNAPLKYNRLIQSIEINDGGIKLTTFPFKTIILPFNLEAIEVNITGNKLEVGKAGYWGRPFGDRELFTILHEGKKYYLVPTYFDDIESIMQVVPFVKVAAS